MWAIFELLHYNIIGILRRARTRLQLRKTGTKIWLANDVCIRHTAKQLSRHSLAGLWVLLVRSRTHLKSKSQTASHNKSCANQQTSRLNTCRLLVLQNLDAHRPQSGTMTMPDLLYILRSPAKISKQKAHSLKSMTTSKLADCDFNAAHFGPCARGPEIETLHLQFAGNPTQKRPDQLPPDVENPSILEVTHVSQKIPSTDL